ncbi:MAG: D-alanyl-D-alanine carboxypeptidase [Legionellales bacterium]|nr:D-alanyl-D-alanine carboxypeptidase [Legionellales bacterium]
MLMRIVYGFTLICCLFIFNVANALIPGKYSSIIIDYNTGKVLYQKDAQVERYPASLTKIMTLYLVFDALQKGQLRLNQQLPVSRNAANKEPSKLGLKPGQYITVQNAIYAIVTKSANDAATVLAEGVGGSEQQFCKMMTAKARMLGMYHTTFYNASGLPHPNQKTTARDMAVLSINLLRKFPQYYHYFSQRNFVYKGKNYRNHNHLLNNYEGTDGIKTGYIRAAGFNLVTSVKRGRTRLIGVVLGGRTAKARDLHMEQLLNQSFMKIGVME